MNITDIIKARSRGELKIQFSTVFRYSLKTVLETFGLFPYDDDLIEISAEQAQAAVKRILWKHLDGSEELMPESDADRYAAYLFADHIPSEGCRFHSNARWYADNGGDYKPFTGRTFDGGILATADKVSICVWVEDED